MERRKFLKVSAKTGVLCFPLLGLQMGCWSEKKKVQSAIEEIPAGFQLVFEGQEKAKQLQYHHNSATVPTEQFPEKDNQALCQSCAYYQKVAGTSKYGRCSLFNDKKWLVSSAGWCPSWRALG